MEAAPKVQLLLKDRLIQELSFSGESLRVGRMKENDLVVNNLAVSRFHAVLHRGSGGQLRIEDLGSENGTFVNGEPVDGEAEINEGDEITIGKHTLRLGQMATGDPALPAAPVGSSDAWDAAQTYFSEGPNGLVESSEATGEPVSLDEVLEAEPLVEATQVPDQIAHSPAELPATALGPAASPDPSGAFSFGEEEILADAVPATGDGRAASDAEFPRPEPAAASVANGEHTALFDFGAAGPLAPETLGGGSAEHGVREALTTEWSPEVDAMETGAPDADLHAGWIVQCKGQLDGVIAWEAESLVVGRAESCDIVLGAAGISRQHATFVRTDAGHEVRDEGSVNGTRVNGERVDGHCALAVGDVVRIEDFELTFVLDHEPVGSEVRSPEAAPRTASGGGQTVFAEAAPVEVVDLLDEAEEDAAEADEGEKRLASSRARRLEPAGTDVIPAPSSVVRVEVEVPRESLPPSLRLALEETDEDSLKLPAEITIRFC